MEKDMWGSTMGIYTNDLKSKYILNELPSTLLVNLKNYKRKRIISIPNSPKPKSKSKSKAKKNPLRKGVVYNSLSNMLKNFANKKRNTPELFLNINDKLKR